MKKIILLFSLFFSFHSYSQYYVDAEIHFLDGSRKEGLAHINILNDKIKFKQNKESKRVSYNHEEIKSLVLKNDSIRKVFEYKKTIGRRAPRLLELIIDNNNISLYAIVTESSYLSTLGLLGAVAKTIVDDTIMDYAFYIVKNNNPKANFFGETRVTSRKRLRQNVKKYLSDCSTLIEKSENKEFKIRDIPKIVQYYNENCGE